MKNPVFVDGEFLKKDAKNYYHTMFLNDLVQFAHGCKTNVESHLETPELASLQLQKYGFGLAAALKIMECNTTVFWDRLDQLIQIIDPNFEINKKKRWESKTGLSYTLDFNDLTSSKRVNPDDTCI